MRVRRDNLHDAYYQIHELSLKCQVVVFASACDCDAVSAYKILNNLFRLDSIPFSVHPVSGPEDLKKQAEENLTDDGIDRAVILLNCGGSLDLTSQYFTGLTPNSRILVVDSHRPLALENLVAGNEQVLLLLGDDTEQFPDVAGLFELGDISDEEEEDDGDSGDEEEGEGSRQRRRLDADGAYIDIERRRELREQKARYKYMINEYYERGAKFGRSSACTMFDLAHQLNRAGKELLWWAILGLADQQVHQRVSHEVYTQGVLELAQHVLAQDRTTTLEDGTVVTVAADSYISLKEEFCFFMHRHWSLFDSMTHSPYIANKLKTYKENGKVAVQRLLAKMGVPLDESKKQFSLMSTNSVNLLDAKLEQYGAELGLTNLKTKSFETQCGYKLKVSAADMVLGVTALLTTSGEDMDWTDSWWQAVDALSVDKNWQLVKRGIQTSKSIQMSIIEQGGNEIAQKNITQAGKERKMFKSCFLHDEVGGNVRLLRNPLALIRFALFLQEEVCRSSNKNRRGGTEEARRPRPMVVVGPRSEEMEEDGSRWNLVVGVVGCPQHGDVEGNPFSVSFPTAAQRANSRHRLVGFDQSVLEVHTDDVSDFMQELVELERERIDRDQMHAAMGGRV